MAVTDIMLAKIYRLEYGFLFFVIPISVREDFNEINTYMYVQLGRENTVH
jgi:hypothetical protein